MSKPYKYLVYIGRFEPWHNGHTDAAIQISKLCEHLIILPGSIQASPDIRNPWSFGQRAPVIAATLDSVGLQGRYTILGHRDYFYLGDNRWVSQIYQIVNSCTSHGDKIGVAGLHKDETSYYMDLFQKWGEPVELEQRLVLNATDIRNEYFKSGRVDGTLVSKPTFEFMQKFKNDPDYPRLVEEWDEMDKYKGKYQLAKETFGIYDPIHVTADPVVFCGGYVLLVKRGGCPGKGQLALPGGFIEQKETAEQACIRELRQETRLKVPPGVLAGKISRRKSFDHPLRSVRGRTITHAFMIQLHEDMPKVKGGDDARSADWYSFDFVNDNPRLLMEDHFQIFEYFLHKSEDDL